MMGFDGAAGAGTRSRRFSPRASVAWTVWVRTGQQRMRCHTVDVSARGAKIRPRGLFQVGTPLQLEFIKPDGQRLRVSGVAWRAEADALAVLFLGTIPQAFSSTTIPTSGRWPRRRSTVSTISSSKRPILSTPFASHASNPSTCS